jgi:hypothetical protein
MVMRLGRWLSYSLGRRWGFSENSVIKVGWDPAGTPVKTTDEDYLITISPIPPFFILYTHKNLIGDVLSHSGLSISWTKGEVLSFCAGRVGQENELLVPNPFLSPDMSDAKKIQVVCPAGCDGGQENGIPSCGKVKPGVEEVSFWIPALNEDWVLSVAVQLIKIQTSLGIN